MGLLVHGFPSSFIKVIGVTGTNGKSTVVTLSKKILEQAGFKVASISSIEFQVGDRKWANELKMTMPGRGYLQKFLRMAIEQRCDYVIVEVTSEGIKQHRHRFIKFDGAVFTNLKPEHIETHGGFKNYKEAKGELWKSLSKSGVSVINLDDEHKDYFLEFPAGKKYGYTIQEASFKQGKIVRAENIELGEESSGFEIDGLNFQLPLSGSFNVSNALAAISIALSETLILKLAKRP